MKHINLSLLPFLGLILIIQSVDAQNYRPFRAGMTYSFEWTYENPDTNINNIVRGLHALRMAPPYLDGQDSIFTFNRIGRDTVRVDTVSSYWYDIIKRDQDNIFGKLLREKPRGVYEFISSDSDTFFIHTQDSLSSTWVFNQKQGISAVTGDRLEMDFLGIRDSVLSIYLSTADTILISKNYGFIQTQSFLPLLFARNLLKKDTGLRYGNKLSRNLKLWGIEELHLGGRLPTFQDLFAIEEGDNLLYKFTAGSFYNDSRFKFWEYYWQTSLGQSVFPNADSVVLTYERNIVDFTSEDVFTYEGKDTLIITKSSEDFYPNKLSLETSENSNIIMRGPYFSDFLNNRLYYVLQYYYHEDTLTNELTSFQPIYQSFASGLGLVFSQGEYGWAVFGPIASFYALCCFEKATDSVGVCLDLDKYTALDPVLTSANLHIYPNPASQIVTISWENLPPGELRIDLLNLQGKRMQEATFVNVYEEKHRLDISSVPPGIYLLRFLWEQEHAGALRLIIK